MLYARRIRICVTTILTQHTVEKQYPIEHDVQKKTKIHTPHTKTNQIPMNSILISFSDMHHVTVLSCVNNSILDKVVQPINSFHLAQLHRKRPKHFNTTSIKNN